MNTLFLLRGKMPRAFTLIELMVATSILMIVMVVLLQLVGSIGNVWKSSAGKISAFQNARSAFSTISRTLSRASLNTYNDYVDASGGSRDANNADTFVPAQFARASELHFISGPAAQIVPGALQEQNPGDAVFFQAPTGEADSAEFKSLNRTLNSIGFYIQYGESDERLLPGWLKPLMGITKRFRLLQIVEPEEKLSVYPSTAVGSYNTDWLNAFKTPTVAPQPRPRVLAEDVSLLMIRPRLVSEDERSVAAQLGVSYNADARGSVLCPNYHYDSRAWQSNYPGGQRVKATSAPVARAALMRNQLPPIVDLVMVCVDRRSLARFNQTSDTPPAALQVPPGLFEDSSRLDTDLDTYSKQLSEAGIRFRVFRTSVDLQGAKWSNN